VLETIARLKYTPNSAARSLAGASQLSVALLYSNPSVNYLSEILMGSMEQARLNNLSLVVERCDFGVDEEAVVRRIAESGIDGFIVPSPLCEEQSLLDLLRKLKVRAVLIGAGKAEPHHSAVMIDDYQAAHDMTAHIIGLGHKRIGFIIGNPQQSSSGLRLSGFLDAMAAAGLEVPESMLAQGFFTYRSGIAAAEKLLDQPDPPTAIFASNDDMAAATVAMALRRHLDVPADLTVCGFDDTAIASTVWPELTTIRQPIQEISRRALELLTNELKSVRAGRSPKPTHITLDYSLVKRQSHAAPGLARGEARKRLTR
jgi:LacI family transcriptional regulator